ncbi:MAG TPA: NAD(P)-dependent oxidoreductase [Nitrososphaeraceae archaeon]
MKIKLLTASPVMKEILLKNLSEVNLTADVIDSNQSLYHQLQDAEILVNSSAKLDRSIIDAAANLKMIHQSGIGVDNIDVEYCTTKSIYVANVPLANAISVAEHTLFLMLFLAKNLKSSGGPNMSVMRRRFTNTLGSDLQGKNLTIIGLGATGIEVAKRARAFGMKIFAVTQPPFSRKGVDKTHYVDNICGPENLLQFLVDADYVSIHTPLGNETRNMIGEKELNFMKKSAYLINVARAPIVAREPLFAALKTRSIAGAAFDVFWNEPPMEEDDKFLQLDNFILSPHIAGWTSEAVEATARIISINIARMSRGEVPLTVVNSELIR